MAAGGEPLSKRFGECKSLTELNLERCTKLVSLPEGIGQLESLTELTLRSCYALQSLPDRFGELTSLRSLYLNDTPAGRSMPAALKAQLEAQGCFDDYDNY